MSELNEDTKAADSVKTKTVDIAGIIAKMQGMSHDDVTKLAETINQYNGGAAAKDVPNGQDEANRKTVAMKTIKEDLQKIFGSDEEELTEEFLDNAATLFESAVNLRVSEIEGEMLKEAAQIVEETIAEREEEILESLDDYLEAAINEWISENKVEIESTIVMEQYKSFIEGLRDLFESHDIDVPEESLDIVSALEEENEELKAKLNEALNDLIEKEKVIEEAEREFAFDQISEGLALTEAEKFRVLVENVEYSDLDDFKKKSLLIREKHFGKTTITESLNEEVNPEAVFEEPAAITNSAMKKYSDAIKKSVKR